MSAPRPYDEPESRTRMAWGRTMLGAVIVTLLLERGLYQQGAGPALAIVGAAPAAALVLTGTTRITTLTPGAVRTSGHGRIVATAGLVLALTLAAGALSAWPT